jgi:hypothetical protein
MFEEGILVRWFEAYADDIPKDTGMGIVIKVRDYPDLQYKNYMVYRTKYSDTMIFGTHHLENCEDKKRRKNEIL